jgi:multidrug efflux pump subunit AcrB
MTALGAIIALMPLALGIGAGAQLHQPLAIAVIGGFLAALPLVANCIAQHAEGILPQPRIC